MAGEAAQQLGFLMKPLAPWLENPATEELCINRPGVHHPFRDCYCLWPPVLATGCQTLQVRQDGHNTSLKQHV